MSKRLVLLSSAVAFLLAGLAAFLFLPRFWSPSRTYDDFRLDALAGYIPEDSAAVITVQMRELLQAPIVQKHFTAPLKAVLNNDPTVRRPFQLTGIDLIRDTEWIQITLSARRPDSPLVLLRGRWDLAHFQLGEGKLIEKGGGPGERYRLFEAARAGFLVAPVGDTVALTASRSRLERALAHAAGERSARPMDKQLMSMLGQVDRKQQVWLVVSFERLGKVPKLPSKIAERLLRPVFTHAASVEGGLRLDDGARGSLRFRARDDSSAEELADHLSALIALAQGVERFGPGLGVDRAWMPLFKLLASGEVRRDGLTVVLRVELGEGALMEPTAGKDNGPRIWRI